MKDNILETAQLVSLMASSLKSDVEGYSRAVNEAKLKGRTFASAYSEYTNGERNSTRGAIENKIKTLRYTLSELMREL